MEAALKSAASKMLVMWLDRESEFPFELRFVLIVRDEASVFVIVYTKESLHYSHHGHLRQRVKDERQEEEC